MLGLKTLLRLVIAAAVITGGLYGIMEFGRPQAAQDPQASVRPADGTALMAATPAVPDFRPSMEAVTPDAAAPGDVGGAAMPDRAHPPADMAATSPVTQPSQPLQEAAAPAPAEPAEETAQETPPADDVAVAQPQTEPSPPLPATGALSDPADEPAPVSPSDKTKKVKTAKGGLICTTFRSYNAESGTYRGLDGKVHDCKPPPLQ